MKKNIVYQSTANFLRFLDKKNVNKKNKDDKNSTSINNNNNRNNLELDFINYNTQELAY